MARKEPIIIDGAGIGLVAKIADRTGIDLIMAYNTGKFRMDGHPFCVGYLAYVDSNQTTLELGETILKLVKKTPVIGGIGAGAPYRDIDQLIERMMAMGFSGIDREAALAALLAHGGSRERVPVPLASAQPHCGG